MTLQLYNSLTRQKEPLKLLQPGKVGMYVCGMTVYDYCHIGHARVLIVFDTVYRYLQALGLDVTYVRNITDIDDKIIKRAQDNDEPWQQLTGRFIDAMHEDADQLYVLRPTHEPRATEFVPQMIAMIETLMAKGFAYQGASGDVFYDISQFEAYGELAQQDLDEMRVGARVDAQEDKRNPLDFVLWKTVKPGEPSWESPWGAGRPGWHLECSAMGTSLLGQTFDLHGGGQDLQFPHHQNEIAQSEATNDCRCVNTWMHVGYVQVAQEKMSKSLGNFFTIREVLEKYSPEVIRYFMLAAHYRSPVNYSTENLDNAEAALRRCYTALRDLPVGVAAEGDFPQLQRFHACMQDDLNTPQALAVLFDLVKEVNRLKAEGERAAAAQQAANLRHLAGILGLLQQPAEDFLQASVDEKLAAYVEAQIAARNTARAEQNWAEADRIRDELLERGVVLEDSTHGTDWTSS